MRNIRTYLRRVVQPPYQLPLKLLLDQMALESWTHSTGQWTKMSTRDGNFGHTRLGSPLKLWKETLRRPKISYLHHWLNGEGISTIEGWKNSKILISQSDYDELENTTGKYSLDKIESYFTLCELALTPRSNPLLAVEDLYLTKQGSMTSGEFHSHILKIVKRNFQTKRQRREPSGMQSSWV